VRDVAYRRLISSCPLPQLARIAGLPVDAAAFRWSKVVVFNFGFDAKGPSGVHWIYFPDRAIPYYRVGFYDNILGGERMSLYVEVGQAQDAATEISSLRSSVLDHLREGGIVSTQQLVAEHSVVLDPAYVHVSARGEVERARLMRLLEGYGIHSIGRYGGWHYCSIEDNIVEAWSLVDHLTSGAFS
jgi:protoporphyrinogen oxidase